METQSPAGYPRKLLFWVGVVAVVALGGLWTRFVGERFTIEWPKIIWAAVALIQKILLEW